MYFENVNFSYEPGNPILKNVNFTITPGMSVAIVGPTGAGKTTIVKAIVDLYKEVMDISYDKLNEKIALLAPTGRASKRMNEISNFGARTIHKTLGYNYDGGFCFNEKSQLSASLYIIDESSMIDINLASTLLSALPLNSQVIFVGDENQLPSVGPGNVFHDFIIHDLNIKSRF